MTRLEFARLLLDYDPETTPQRELDEANRSVREVEIQNRLDQRAIDELDDTAVYEWSYDNESQCHRATKREIAKRTPKQIRIAPKYAGERQTYLPRQPLDAGEFVRHGKGWWRSDFVFGRMIRPKLKEQHVASAMRLQECRGEVRRIEHAIANHDIVVGHQQMELWEMFIQREPPQRETIIPVNWKEEGF